MKSNKSTNSTNTTALSLEDMAQNISKQESERRIAAIGRFLDTDVFDPTAKPAGAPASVQPSKSTVQPSKKFTTQPSKSTVQPAANTRHPSSKSIQPSVFNTNPTQEGGSVFPSVESITGMPIGGFNPSSAPSNNAAIGGGSANNNFFDKDGNIAGVAVGAAAAAATLAAGLYFYRNKKRGDEPRGELEMKELQPENLKRTTLGVALPGLANLEKYELINHETTYGEEKGEVNGVVSTDSLILDVTDNEERVLDSSSQDKGGRSPDNNVTSAANYSPLHNPNDDLEEDRPATTTQAKTKTVGQLVRENANDLGKSIGGGFTAVGKSLGVVAASLSSASKTNDKNSGSSR